MTQDEIKELAYNAGFSIANGIVTGGINDLKRFAKLVAEAEREACAKVCDDHGKVWADRFLFGFQATLDDAADAIRSRGEA